MQHKLDEHICAFCLHFTRHGIAPYCEKHSQTVSCYDAACQEWKDHINGTEATPRKEKPE